jgi:asparagine synthase (glutamine-hydrolysing)
MCGIAGSWSPDADAEDPWVADALDRIAHRGPDVLLSYVGELWNYRELRAGLEKIGHEFETEGDTEVLAAYLDAALGHGASLTEAVRSLDGQFAFAVTESLSGRTWLARDRLGEVPLYVMEQEAASLFDPSGIRWSSERRVFGSQAADAVPVPAGTVWPLGGVPEPFYALPARTENRAGDSEEVEELLRRAVKRRLQADVPIAFLASGGLDSSLILRLVQDEGVPVTAYTAIIPGIENPDLVAARRICADLGIELREVEAEYDPVEAIRAIEIAMKAQVEIATLCLPLAERIYADGYRVVLSGEGADELFGGYGNLMRKATGDAEWHRARRASVEKMARGNCIRTNKSFFAHGVEARLPFLDRDLIDCVLPLGVKACPPGKGLLKRVGARVGLPDWLIEQKKRTFQGAAGTSDLAEQAFEENPIKVYNGIARELFGGLPRG